MACPGHRQIESESRGEEGDWGGEREMKIRSQERGEGCGEEEDSDEGERAGDEV